MVAQISGASPPGGWRRAAVCGAAGIALVVVSSSRWSATPVASEPGVPATTVVVAAQDLPAGAVVASAMLTMAPVAAGATAGLASDGAPLAGRVLLVPVVKGEPVGFGMTAPHPAAPAGHRLVRVSIALVDVAPDVTVGGDADLVASFPAAAAGQKASVSVVATARVASLEPQAGGSASSSPPPDPGAGLIGATAAVTLDCTSSDALRILWARDNARTLRLLDHPAGDPAPPPASA